MLVISTPGYPEHANLPQSCSAAAPDLCSGVLRIRVFLLYLCPRIHWCPVTANTTEDNTAPAHYRAETGWFNLLGFKHLSKQNVWLQWLDLRTFAEKWTNHHRRFLHSYFDQLPSWKPLTRSIQTCLFMHLWLLGNIFSFSGNLSGKYYNLTQSPRKGASLLS